MPFTKNALISDYNDLYKKIYDKEKFVNLWVNNISFKWHKNRFKGVSDKS
jgi:hypothetical protein